VSHPLRGGMDRNNPDISTVVRNKEEVDKICRTIAETFPDVLILSPINAFSFFEVFKEDKQALEMDLKLLELADTVRVCGDWQNSEGCKLEIARARELGITICYDDGHFEFPNRTAPLRIMGRHS
jgi:hypothetical protein